MTDHDVLVRVEGLKMYFPITKGLVIQRHVGDIKAVDGVNFSIRQGETLGLVGESGCGKSTTGRAILQLYRPTEGHVYFHEDGEEVDLTEIKGERLRHMRRKMQMIFQDPYASLNPRMTVGNIVGEPLEVHNISRGRERRERVQELLQVVGLNPYFINRYPHEFSGGQRQRIGIARALILSPDLVVADEPVSALDVSVQAQVLNLLKELQSELDLTLLFVAHNLGVVEHISDRVAVMYLGRIVELADRSSLYANPVHPYTEALLSAIPVPDPDRPRNRQLLQGEIPSPLNPPVGCHFHPRCPIAKPGLCDIEEPPLADSAFPGHRAACLLRTGPRATTR